MEVREGMSEVVLTVGPGHSLREAARMMTEKGVGAAIVIDEEAPGPRIISERDLLVSIGRGEDPDAERVADHMSDSVITAAPDWSLERAAAEMAARRIRHLVICRRRRPRRRALDARHHARLDLRRGDVGDDAGLGRQDPRSGPLSALSGPGVPLRRGSPRCRCAARAACREISSSERRHQARRPSSRMTAPTIHSDQPLNVPTRIKAMPAATSTGAQELFGT